MVAFADPVFGEENVQRSTSNVQRSTNGNEGIRPRGTQAPLRPASRSDERQERGGEGEEGEEHEAADDHLDAADAGPPREALVEFLIEPAI